MNREIRQLAVIASICFFPTALAGWLVYGKSEGLAIRLFRASIFVFLFTVLVVGIVVVLQGGRLIKPMGSFF